MKKRLFGLKARDKRNLSRYKEDVIDLDEDYDEDYEDYEDDDYPDEDYEDDDYPDEDYEDDDYPENEVEDDRYEDDDYPEDEVKDNRYEDEDYPEEAEDEPEDRYEDEDDYPEDDSPEDEVEKERFEEDYRDEEDYPEDDYENEDYPEEDRYDDRYEDDDYPEDEDDGEYYPEDYEDEDYPEDGYEDDYPEDDRYDDRRGRGKRKRDRGESVPARILGFLANTSATERIAAIFALFILAGGIATASFYMKAMGNRQQIDSFAEVGANLSEETIYGQSGLIAVADAERARAMAAELVSDDAFVEEEEEEVPDDAEDVTIKMTLTSIKSDMKVKFINSQTGKLVANLPLEIDVETPDGSKVTYNDHDQDGIIYKKDITAGVYKITPKSLPSGYENYKLEIKTQSLTVKDQVEMKAVDVSNEVKKESQVNAAKEDTAVKTEVESQLQDTVEWVDSNQNSSDGGIFEYKEIDKKDIVDPSQSAMIGLRSFMFLGMTGNSDKAVAGKLSSTESGSADNSSEGKSEEIKDDQVPKDPSPTDPSPTDPEPTDPAPTDPKPDAPEPTDPKPTDPTPTDPEPTTPEPSDDKDKNKEEGNNSGENTENNKKENKTIANFSINEGSEYNLTQAGVSSNAKATSSNSEVISVRDNIILVAKKAGGSSVITITDEKYNIEPFTVTVNAVDKAKVKVDADSFSIEEKKTRKISVTDANNVSFTSDAETIASVSKDGTVTGVSAGTAHITVKDLDGKYDDNVVTVTVTKVADQKVPLGVTTKTLSEGQSFKVEPTEKGLSIKLTSNKPDKAAVSDQMIVAKSEGEAIITVSAQGYQDNTITIKVVRVTLKDRNGNDVYVEENGKYRLATSADYFNGKKFLLKVAGEVVKHGWWTIDGNTYYFDKNGNYVTGEQVISGVKYTFDSSGVLTTSSGTTGIDVCKWNGNIDWKAVKNSGVQFVIIRCGYRGSSEGQLIEDPLFRKNIQGAQSVGLRVGVYFYTQAVNEVEAVEEASMAINLIKGYNISFPVYLDVEASHGRGDGISAAQRTANIKAFCGTIQNAGYKAGVYANKTWFTSYINTPQLTNYKIWLAQYAAQPTYSATRYDMWQCTSKGSVPGISGKVDMNICY